MGPRLRGPRDAGVAGCPSRGRPEQDSLGSFRQNARLSPLVPSPLAGEGAMVCAQTRTGEGFAQHSPHPSSHVAAPSCPLPQGERAQQLRPRLWPYSLFKQPISFSRRVGVRGLRLLLRSPRIEGGRSAERRSGARRNTREAYHDAGRSPLGAPPWRFWAPGAALASPAFAPDRLQRAPRTQVVVPGGRGPEPPGANGYKPPPQDATPRSAFRSLPEDALNERGWEWF